MVTEPQDSVATQNLDPMPAETPQSNSGTKVTTKPRTTRKAPATVRTLEELHNTTARSMTEAEKIKYISELRDLASLQHFKIEELDQTCKSSFEQNRTTEQKFAEYRMKANAKFQYARQAIDTANMGIRLLGSLED